MTLKHSKQRDSIIDFLSTRKDHPTADTIYMNVRQTFPNISLGTVYRNLTLLADMGEILRIRVGDGLDHFDFDTSPHYHFICSQCGGVSDLDMKNTDDLTAAAQQNFKGEVDGHVIYFYGRCPNCNSKH